MINLNVCAYRLGSDSPNSDHRLRAPFKIPRKVIVLASFLIAVACAPAQAQQSQHQRLMAVMTVVNHLLLNDREAPIPRPAGQGVALDLNEKSPDSYTLTSEENLFAEFELEQAGVELCFILESADAIAPGDLSIEVNGEPQAAQLGENCIALANSEQRLVNYINIIVNQSGISVTLTTLELQSENQSQLLLPRLTRGEWDERAVRKVLKIFAFGGHATDAQIITWSEMSPADAIQEMLNFDEHNLKLSPLAVGENYPESATMGGTLTEWQNFISSPSSNLPIPVDNRDQYGLNGYNFDDAYNRMITVRGLNPFRQRIGFWETNYHLATNLDTDVTRPQMAHYYDIIMQAHEAGLPYHEVMGVAAKSAAVAMQYGHRFNEWNANTGECECNDDFAREIHQLFYGIFGEGAPFHEDLTIPETAKMLTDMQVRYDGSQLGGYPLVVNFQTDDHHTGGVYIFKPNDGTPNITGADASAKIDNLMPLSMQHPESLQNLPIMIISVLADDNLSESAKNQLRASWASMGVDRVLLDFLHAYAISDLFHGPQHFKYLTTHERALYIANKHNLDNLEAYFGGGYYNGDNAGRTVGSIINEDFAGDFFRPTHNVFGGQTSTEAASSALAFENHFNRLTDREHDLREAVSCSTCDLGQPWVKKWAQVLPQRNGQYYVSDVAEWLWNHAVGNMDNYTELERAHLYAILGAARNELGDDHDGDGAYDFNLMMCVIADHAYDPEGISATATITEILATNLWDDFCRSGDDGGSLLPHEVTALNTVYTGQIIADSPQIQAVLNELGNQTLPLTASGPEHHEDGANLRRHARERVSSALNFIFTTPFIFAEGQ